MATVDDVLAIARKYVGVTENPPGSNVQPFAPLAGHPEGQPWCASFVVAVFREAGMSLPSESAWTPSMAEGFKPSGAWHAGADGAEPGDVLFWDFPDASQGIQHVSIATSTVHGGEIDDVGGNTSSHAAGSQDNGGGVFANTRTAAWVACYGRPAYSGAAAPPAPAPAAPVARPMIRRGAQGPDVKYLQQHLGIPADGIFGPQTDGAVRHFQSAHGLGVDGIVGPLTWRAIG